MKREELRSLISTYSRPTKRSASPARSTRHPAAKLHTSGHGYSNAQKIVAKQDRRLTRLPKPTPAKRFHTDDMSWVTMSLPMRGGQVHEYKGLRIGDDPFIAVRSDGPQGTSNKFYIYDIRSGTSSGRLARGARSDIYRALKRELQESIERAERKRQQAIYEAEEAQKEVEQRKLDHEDNHGPGFYILPYYSIPEIAGDDESDSDLYGAEEGDALGPFHRQETERRSIAEDQAGTETLEDIEDLYWALWKKLPSKHAPFILIEAANRKNALARHGHVWISDGLEKGPPVDPRQTGFHWSK